MPLPAFVMLIAVAFALLTAKDGPERLANLMLCAGLGVLVSVMVIRSTL